MISNYKLPSGFNIKVDSNSLQITHYALNGSELAVCYYEKNLYDSNNPLVFPCFDDKNIIFSENPYYTINVEIVIQLTDDNDRFSGGIYVPTNIAKMIFDYMRCNNEM